MGGGVVLMKRVSRANEPPERSGDRRGPRERRCEGVRGTKVPRK